MDVYPLSRRDEAKGAGIRAGCRAVAPVLCHAQTQKCCSSLAGSSAQMGSATRLAGTFPPALPPAMGVAANGCSDQIRRSKDALLHGVLAAAAPRPLRMGPAGSWAAGRWNAAHLTAWTTMGTGILACHWVRAAAAAPPGWSQCGAADNSSDARVLPLGNTRWCTWVTDSSWPARHLPCRSMVGARATAHTAPGPRRSWVSCCRACRMSRQAWHSPPPRVPPSSWPRACAGFRARVCHGSAGTGVQRSGCPRCRPATGWAAHTPRS